MTAPSWVTPSGNIGSVLEGNAFAFGLQYTGSTPLSIALIAGQLPHGLSLDNSGNITGTVGLVEAQVDYDFTVRLTNSDGFADRTFTITVLNQSASWSDPLNLGTYPPDAYFEHSFFVNDPGGTQQTFEKISGELPPGLELNVYGKLYGIVGEVSSVTVYNFTLRSFFDSGLYLDRNFTITVDPAALAAPVWLTPGGFLGNIQYNTFASFQVLAKDPQGNTINFTAIGLPPGLSIDNTGLISGTLSSDLSNLYSFSITATSGVASSSRIFSLLANQTTTFGIGWVTPEGSIGSIREGDKSLLSIESSSSSPWTRYRLNGGSLPAGLSLDIDTGNIVGLAQEQTPVDAVYSFQVEAYNETNQISGNFSITLLNNYDPGATRVYLTLYGNAKLNFIDLFTTPEVMIGSIFREGDPEFGLINYPRILLAENLANPTADQVYDALQGVRRTYLNFGKVLVGKAVVDNEVVYEVLYRKIYDDMSGAALEYTTPTPPHVDIKPGSLINLRTRLLDLGSSGPNGDNLPLWMQSPQTIGDNTTIPGWVPCLEFAYVLPGTGQTIADKINSNDIQLKKLYNNRYRIDRIIMEPAADNTFKSRFILFDNQF